MRWSLSNPHMLSAVETPRLADSASDHGPDAPDSELMRWHEIDEILTPIDPETPRGPEKTQSAMHPLPKELYSVCNGTTVSSVATQPLSPREPLSARSVATPPFSPRVLATGASLEPFIAEHHCSPRQNTLLAISSPRTPRMPLNSQDSMPMTPPMSPRIPMTPMLSPRVAAEGEAVQQYIRADVWDVDETPYDVHNMPLLTPRLAATSARSPRCECEPQLGRGCTWEEEKELVLVDQFKPLENSSAIAPPPDEPEYGSERGHGWLGSDAASHKRASLNAALVSHLRKSLRSSGVAPVRTASLNGKLRPQNAAADFNAFKQNKSLSKMLNALGLSEEACSTAQALNTTDGDDEHLEILRGINVTTLLETFCVHFSSGVAYGEVTGQASPSFPVDSLDDFVSHSWRAGRWLKYCALCLVYNGNVALALCALSSILAFCLWDELLTNQYDLKEFEWPVKPFACALGFFVYVFSLQFYQRIRQLLRLRLNTVFFDKLCIDQQDVEMLKLGIQSLSVFLMHTRRMIILWDRTYFTRAWCVFEVAMREHFFRNTPLRSDITFFPLELARICVLLCIIVWVCVAALVASVNAKPGNWQSQLIITTITQIVVWACGIYAARIGREHARDMTHLETSLIHFSWQDAQCFSEGDYEAISSLLCHWFGSVCEFDEYVSGEFREAIIDQIGGTDSISYYTTLPVCMAIASSFTDYIAYVLFAKGRDPIEIASMFCFAATSIFAAVPLVFKLFIYLCGRAQQRRDSWIGEACVNLSIWLAIYASACTLIAIPGTLDVLHQRTGNRVFLITHIAFDLFLVLVCVKSFKHSVQRLRNTIRATFGRLRGSQADMDHRLSQSSAGSTGSQSSAGSDCPAPFPRQITPLSNGSNGSKLQLDIAEAADASLEEANHQSFNVDCKEGLPTAVI